MKDRILDVHILYIQYINSQFVKKYCRLVAKWTHLKHEINSVNLFQTNLSDMAQVLTTTAGQLSM